MSYLINWKWNGIIAEETKRNSTDKELHSHMYKKKADYFDLATAPDEWLHPDPRVRWLRDAYLTDRDNIDKCAVASSKNSDDIDPGWLDISEKSGRATSASGGNLLYERMKNLVLRRRSHDVPLHRALSCDVEF